MSDEYYVMLYDSSFWIEMKTPSALYYDVKLYLSTMMFENDAIFNDIRKCK